MRLFKVIVLLLCAGFIACSADPKFEGDDLNSYLVKDSIFELTAKRHFSYYAFIN
jgi:hypothetical protein